MGNYIAINSKFDPFSYEELLKNAMVATEAHHKLEDELMQYDVKGSQIGAYLDKNLDRNQYNQFNKWSEQVGNLASLLSSSGLKSVDRTTLMQSKRDYNKLAELLPAIQQRQKDRDMHAELKIKDESLETNYNPFNTSLDSYANGKSPTLHTASGYKLQEEAKTIAAAISSRTFSDNKIYLDPRLEKQYFSIMSKNGFSQKEAERFLKSKDAEKIIDGLIEKRNTNNWMTEDQKNRLRIYAIDGFNSGLTGSQTTTYQHNKQWEYDMKVMEELLKNKEKEDDDLLEYLIDPVALFTPEEEDQYTNVKDYFSLNENGDWELNDLGKKALDSRNINNATFVSQTNAIIPYTSYNPKIINLYNLLDDLSNLGHKEYQSRINNYMNRVVNSYDATSRPTYRVPIDDNQRELAKEVLMRAYSGKEKVMEIGWDKDSQRFKEGKTTAFNYNELGNPKTKITSVYGSSYGLVFEVKDSRGYLHKIPYIDDNNITSLRVQQNFKMAMSLAESLYNGYFIDPYTGQMTPITNLKQYEKLKLSRAKAIKDGVTDILSMFNSYDVKKIKVEDAYSK